MLASNRESPTIYYNILGILKFENVVKLKISTFTHKLNSNPSSIPSIFLDFLTPVLYLTYIAITLDMQLRIISTVHKLEQILGNLL